MIGEMSNTKKKAVYIVMFIKKRGKDRCFIEN